MKVRYIEIKTSPAGAGNPMERQDLRMGDTPVAALVQQPRDFSELQEV